VVLYLGIIIISKLPQRSCGLQNRHHVFWRGIVLRPLKPGTHASSRITTTMADNNDDEDTLSRRESHFNHQRSSLRSETSHILSRSRPQSGQRLDNFDLDSRIPDRADSETLPSPSSPAPNVPYTRPKASSDVKGKNKGRAYSARRHSRSGPDDAKRLEDRLAPESWANSYELLASPPIPLHDLGKNTERENASSRTQQRPRRSSFPFGRIDGPGSQLDITALPSITASNTEMDPYSRSKPTPSAQSASRIATELYTISYLVFFAIWGTLARLGLQALTFYPGAPVIFSELWANVAGTFIMGFLAEDRRLFHAEWGNQHDPITQDSKPRHGKVKKTIPLYIGLATGFCGSFTSFSSFMRDVFLALSNDLRAPNYHPYPAGMSVPAPSSTVPRNAGYSVMAVLATTILTLSTCYAALQVGAHFASLLDPIMPTLPFRLTRRVVDPLFVLLGWGCWIGAVLMAIFPPHNAWRSQALFACVFAPVGCLLRYYASLVFNPILPSFPLGTFTVNIFGTAVLGMAYDLQRVPLRFSGIVGGSLIGCQVLQGIQDGFCGTLTTVSTWIAEIDTLAKKKRRNAYVYGGVSVAVGVALLVIIMGSVRWGVGWQDIICIT
jgi:CrcB protein